MGYAVNADFYHPLKRVNRNCMEIENFHVSLHRDFKIPG